jgi:uncharacterized membrane protein HdeD (DUF308 family)
MALSPRSTFVLVLGVLMIALGLYVAIRPLLGAGRPLTGARWLDIAFAAVFLLRGVMNVQAARRRPRVQGEPPMRRP